MNALVPAEAHRFEEANDVMELYGKGYKPFQIAKELGLKRALVDEHITEWKESVKGSTFIRDRVEELLVQLDEHFSELQKQLHWTLDSIPKSTKDHLLLAQRTGAIKALAEIATKRIDALQKAGLLDAADLGDEIAETEEKVAQVTTLLKELSNDCERCAPIIRERISQMQRESMGNTM